eukprot:7385034-Prymnesium_polylepis.2
MATCKTCHVHTRTCPHARDRNVAAPAAACAERHRPARVVSAEIGERQACVCASRPVSEGASEAVAAHNTAQ